MKNKQFLIILFIIAVFWDGCSTASINDEEKPFEFMVEKGVPTDIVNIDSGKIKGENLNGVNRYLGIPYAQSIAGRNRFKPPQAVKPWGDIFIADH